MRAASRASDVQCTVHTLSVSGVLHVYGVVCREIRVRRPHCPAEMDDMSGKRSLMRALFVPVPRRTCASPNGSRRTHGTQTREGKSNMNSFSHHTHPSTRDSRVVHDYFLPLSAGALHDPCEQGEASRDSSSLQFSSLQFTSLHFQKSKSKTGQLPGNGHR